MQIRQMLGCGSGIGRQPLSPGRTVASGESRADAAPRVRSHGLLCFFDRCSLIVAFATLARTRCVSGSQFESGLIMRDVYSGLPMDVRDSHNAKLCKTIGGPHRFALILHYAQDDRWKNAIIGTIVDGVS